MATAPVEIEPKLQHQGPPGGYGGHGLAATGAGEGLEVLRNLNSVTILQSCTCCPCVTCNSKYRVLDDNDRELFKVLEDTSCCMRYLCGIFRSFEIHIVDSHENEVMQFRRSITCGQCISWCGNYFLPCCMKDVEVCAPPSNVIGKIQQNFSLCTPSFSGLDAMDHVKFHISGDFCRFPCFMDLKFKILSNDNDTEIGSITKTWTNCLNEMCTNAHKFNVDFPSNADVQTKALILAAAVQIDYQHFT